jgi:hypothetical protein
VDNVAVAALGEIARTPNLRAQPRSKVSASPFGTFRRFAHRSDKGRYANSAEVGGSPIHLDGVPLRRHPVPMPTRQLAPLTHEADVVSARRVGCRG